MSDRHPLDPLDAGEITRSVALARTAPGLGARVRVIFVEAREPGKAAYHAWRDGGAHVAREAVVTLVDCEHGRGLVAESTSTATGWPTSPSWTTACSPPSRATSSSSRDVMRADPRFREAISKRGIDDPEKVYVESWSAASRARAARAWRAPSLAEADLDRQPLRPAAGGLVGASTSTRLAAPPRRPRHPAPPPPPAATTATAVGGPIATTSGRSRSPSRTVRASRSRVARRWSHWDLRIGFHPREGLVLHEVASTRPARPPVCHRASIAELVIPYGDPNPTAHFKNAFDIGEYGLGPLTTRSRWAATAWARSATSTP